MRVEHDKARGGPFRRRRDDRLELTLALNRVEDLFAPPALGPFDPGFERSRDQPGIGG